MAYKKSYSRKYSSKRIVVKPKIPWSLARKSGSMEVHGPKKNGSWPSNKLVTTYANTTLIQATTDGSYTAGPTRKVKHLRIEITRSFTVDNEKLHQALVKMKAYIVFLPQGVDFSTTNESGSHLSTTLVNHPEWILAEKTLNCNYKSDSSTVSNQTINCKLSKNLRSGDGLYLIVATTYNTNRCDDDMSGHILPVNIEYQYAITP